MRNHDVAELRRLDVAHHLAPQQDWQAVEDMGGSRIIVRGEGSTIIDGDGVRLLDGMAGLWCVNVGYGRTELADAAYKQMLELPYYNSFFKTTTPPTVELATKLAGLLGGRLQHIFFNSSGSEAIDTLIRTARHYWQVKGEPNRNIIIARTNGYHGSTIAGMSLGGMAPMHAQGGPLLPGFVHVMQPYKFVEGFDESEEAFAMRAAQAVEDAILAAGPENVAAFIGEPVQGAGGVIIPPAGYWPRVEAICRKYGVLLCCDEVICGFGRLGQWFGHQHYGISPDLVTMAKGLSSGYLPISAVGVADFIVETIKSNPDDFVHGYTYSGHPTAAAVALKNLEIMEREDLVRRTREDSGPYLARRLAELAQHPLVGEARSLGLIGAVEIVAEPGTNRRFGTGRNSGIVVRDLCIARGLMVRAVKDSIVMSPPLIITHAEIDRLVDTIADALTAAEPALKSLADEG
ncbi:aspartate aminotransferase family protein [Sandarakinorhabdus rubra]|uniref:aspartate aminotransferase family protein n=1 Tax=Sandarakinorhabdus rubra TaxID=2672568 RepID=UPI001F2E72FD|nr:aspartate aminotransferase family protein [Sandarakinorhabdus rubra]